jgi:hypothetical protein
MMNTPTEIIALSPRAAAPASSLSLRSVMEANASGALPSTRVGRRRVIFPGDLGSYPGAAGQASSALTTSPSTHQGSRRSGKRQRG